MSSSHHQRRSFLPPQTSKGCIPETQEEADCPPRGTGPTREDGERSTAVNPRSGEVNARHVEPLFCFEKPTIISFTYRDLFTMHTLVKDFAYPQVYAEALIYHTLLIVSPVLTGLINGIVLFSCSLRKLQAISHFSCKLNHKVRLTLCLWRPVENGTFGILLAG